MQFAAEVAHGIGKLGENQNLLPPVLFADQFFQFGELAIRRRIPRLGQLEHGEEALGIEP